MKILCSVGLPVEKCGKSKSKMAARQTERFLSPAHFQVIPNKSRNADEEKKLLPPGAYEKVVSPKVIVEKQPNGSKDDLKKAQGEIDILRDEIQVLKELLDKSKERESTSFQEGKHQRYSNRGLNDNLQQLAEVEAENESLLSENRKQQAIMNKLRNDLKKTKMDYMAEIEKLDSEVGTYNTTIRQLKQDLKEKDAKYDEQLDNLKALLKTETMKVKELKVELRKTHKQIKADRDNFEDLIGQHATQKYQDVSSLQDMLKNYKSKYVSDVNELNNCIKEKSTIIKALQDELVRKDVDMKKQKEENRIRKKELENKMEQCKVEIVSSQEMFETTSNELKFALQKTIESHGEALEEFQEKLDSKDKQIKEQQSTIEQLKAYIGENLPNIQLERLENENQQLKDKLEALEQENKNVNSNIQFMKIRLQSLNEILTLQENELNKSLLAGENGRENVLTKWREKVYTLLVQLKSQEITKDNDNNKNKHMVSELQEECESLKNSVNILSHTIADRNAELQIECNRTRSLENELSENQANEKLLQSKLMEYQCAMSKLYNDSINMVPFVNQLSSKMTDAFSKLDCLSQRVSFATGRVQFVQGLLACRQEKLKQENEIKVRNEDTEKVDENQQSSYKELLDEIARLTQERGMLNNQAVKDAELLECRVENVRAGYEDKVYHMSCKLEQFEMELRDERERFRALGDKVIVLESDLVESNETLENLKMDLARHDSDTEKKLSEALENKQATFVEEMAELEKQLNSVRGEHTKTLIALHQAEHQVSREKVKATEQLDLQQKDFDMKIERLEHKTKSLEKERNMLMATVRQEGIIPPKQRPKPYQRITDSSDIDQEEKGNKLEERPVITKQKHKTGISQKLDITKDQDEHDEQSIASALHDLKFLSEALLNMQDDNV